MLDCDMVISELELHLLCYVHFYTNTPEKGMNPFIKRWIVPLLFFYKKGCGIKLLTTVDTPSNEETKPNCKYKITTVNCSVFLDLMIVLFLTLG